MGRKSALTPEQWIEIERRIVVDGDSVYMLAKEYGVNESSIRRALKPSKIDKAEKAEKIDKYAPELKELAIRKARSEEEAKKIASEISALPVPRQRIVSDLASKLMNISEHMASAAEYSAATAHRLAAIANGQIDKVDDEEPEKSVEALKRIQFLTGMATEASKIPINLINANKETIADMNKDQSKDAPSGLSHFYGED